LLALVASLLTCGMLAFAHRAVAETPAPEGCPTPVAGAASLAQAPAQILVCVQSVPITGAEFTHWVEVAEKSGGGKPKNLAGERGVTEESLGFLISSDWLVDEARALHIHLAARTVRRNFERVRAQQFPKPGEFGAFMKRTGQTPADLMFRVRLNLLSKRIEAHVEAKARGVQAQQRALSRFIKDFKRHWQSRTYCTTEYAVPDCGHIVAPPL
jgi:hypothetical protein